MANAFQVNVPNVLQALVAGETAFTKARDRTKQNLLSAARSEAQNALSSGGDTRSALARLIGAGDVQGANAIANFGNQDFERQFRLSESQRQQGNVDRAFDLQRQTANTATIQTVKDASGNETLVRVDRQGNAAPIPVGQSQPANPFATGGKQTEGQANAGLFASRMLQSEKILRDTEGVGADVFQFGLSQVPGVGNFLVSEKRQKFDQAKRDFINAVLRRESGAVISESEFANAERQLFPRPGDTAEVIAQKRRNREASIRGIAGAAGPSFQPSAIFDESGDLVPRTSNDVRGAASQGGNLIAEARDAIARGAPRAAVIQRLQQQGINPAGL